LRSQCSGKRRAFRSYPQSKGGSTEGANGVDVFAAKLSGQKDSYPIASEPDHIVVVAQAQLPGPVTEEPLTVSNLSVESQQIRLVVYGYTNGLSLLATAS
jgi:hypothetical protein